VKKYEGSTSVSPSESARFSAVLPDKRLWGARAGDRYNARTTCEGFFVRVNRVRPSPRLEAGISGEDDGGFVSIKEVSSSICKSDKSSLSNWDAEKALKKFTLPSILKTAPFAELNNGLSKVRDFLTYEYYIVMIGWISGPSSTVTAATVASMAVPPSLRTLWPSKEVRS
jgi:hypothetical protein